MKQPNGYGSVTKLTGSRRKPYMVRITTGKVYDEQNKKSYCERKVLGYYRTRAEALAALGAYNMKPYNLDSKSITLKEVWELIKDKVDVSDNRRKVYKSTFNKYLSSIADMRMSDIKTLHLQEIIDNCEYGYSTQSNIRSVLNHIYSYSMQNDIIDKDYMQFVKLEAPSVELEREVYSIDEIAQIWEHKDIDDYAFTLVLLYQGMRITELVELNKDNVNLEDNTITITKGKNNYSLRTIPINMNVRSVIESQMNTPGSSLFSISNRHYAYFVKNNLNHNPYDTRHTFASMANELNIKVVVAQRIMGHKPKTVLEETYTHLKMDELRNAINKICYQRVTN